jgi:putative redox protein
MSNAAAKITFNGADGQSLDARLDRPQGEIRAYALFAHCFTCGKNALAAARISKALAERGIAVLRFDFTGLGSSEGDFANTSFSSNVSDLIAAADHLRQSFEAPALLIGHSLGGAAVLRAALDIPEARLVATIGAPADPSHVERLLEDSAQEIRRKGKARVNVGGRSFEIGEGFLDDIKRHRPGQYISRMDAALMVFHAPRDEVVGIDNAREIYEAARHPKSFVSLDGADHLLTENADAVYLADILSAWAARYIGETEKNLADRPGDGVVRVGETGRGRFEQEILTDAHRLVADEPASAGGDDHGLNPYELLAAALGACTSMTIRMYADRREVPLERVSVDVRHEKIHAADCADCETREGKIDRLGRIITLEGDLDEDQRRKLMEIADKCPVHRTLTGEIRIETKEA